MCLILQQLQLHNKKVAPFKYLGLAKDYNGVDIHQTKQYFGINCPGYIDRVIRAHGWNQPGDDEIQSRPTSPLPDKALDNIFKEQGPIEGSKEYKALQKRMGFAYRTLLGELLYAYVTCRPDIGFEITTMAKFSTHPSELHHRCLEGIATHLQRTRNWGMRYKTNFSNGVPSGPYPATVIPVLLPHFFEDNFKIVIN